MKLRIALPMSVKNCVGILMGIVVSRLRQRMLVGSEGAWHRDAASRVGDLSTALTPQHSCYEGRLRLKPPSRTVTTQV